MHLGIWNQTSPFWFSLILLFSQFDLVPIGIGSSILNKYKLFFTSNRAYLICRKLKFLNSKICNCESKTDDSYSHVQKEPYDYATMVLCFFFFSLKILICIFSMPLSPIDAFFSFYFFFFFWLSLFLLGLPLSSAFSLLSLCPPTPFSQFLLSNLETYSNSNISN